MVYDIDAKISKAERLILEQLRLIVSNHHGMLITNSGDNKLTVKVDGGKIVDCIPSLHGSTRESDGTDVSYDVFLPVDKCKLKELQA